MNVGVDRQELQTPKEVFSQEFDIEGDDDEDAEGGARLHAGRPRGEDWYGEEFLVFIKTFVNPISKRFEFWEIM